MKYIILIFLLIFLSACNGIEASIDDNDVVSLKKHIDESGNVNQKIGNFTAVQYAVYKGQYDVVKYLLANGAKLRPMKGHSYIEWAIISGDKRLVMLLIDYGVKVNNINISGMDPHSNITNIQTSCNYQQYICDLKKFAYSYYKNKRGNNKVNFKSYIIPINYTFENPPNALETFKSVTSYFDDETLSFNNYSSENINIVFLEFEKDGIWKNDPIYAKGYIKIPNSGKKIDFNIKEEHPISCKITSFSGRDAKCFKRRYKGFSFTLLNKLKNIITKTNYQDFKMILDKQIALQKEKELKYLQQKTAKRMKEQEGIDTIIRLAKEKNYKKLKKVLKIKPEYKSLLDSKTQTMLIGYYCLGEIAKALQSGMSDEQMIKELEKSNSTYLSYFSLEQKDYLREEGLSSRLIEFLELHTQEMNLKREQKRRIAKMERQIEREEAEAREAIEQDRQREKRRRERQAKNNDDAQRWKDMSNALTKTTNDMMSNIQYRSNQQHYANDAYNNAISPKKRTTNYNNSYRSEQREINNNYNTKLANIKAKKMKLKNQQIANNINCYTSGSYTTGKYHIGDTGEVFQSKSTKVVALTYFKYGSSKYPLEEEDVIFRFQSSDARSCPYASVDDAIEYIYNHNKHFEDFREWKVILK